MTMAAALETTPQPSGLRGCGDLELLDLVRSLPRGSEVRNSACELLVDRYQTLVRSCVRRYRSSPESQEDLMQVGYVGLLHAINNFDPAAGSSLAAYALPCISGEIKRHFRDKRWQVHVRRSVQDLRPEIRRAVGELTQQLARMPKDAELARHLNLSGEDLADAQRGDLALEAWSLDAPVFAGDEAVSLVQILGGDDPRLERTLDVAAVRTHMGELPDREQRLLMMRFYRDMSQAEIGKRLGISQMHVSRLLRHALGYLRERVLAT